MNGTDSLKPLDTGAYFKVFIISMPLPESPKSNYSAHADECKIF
ncbi:hypothetical protein SAMN05660479_00075 [Microbulbifer thermotolerans]|nr:hypothetical protein SAMN05660479_00075 [Microbulbifer thermotolerans]